MLLIFIILYMADYITTFKNDINIFINDLMEKKIIQDFDFTKLSIDYSSKSKQGDLSTNLFLILLKKILIRNLKLKGWF